MKNVIFTLEKNGQVSFCTYVYFHYIFVSRVTFSIDCIAKKIIKAQF